MDKDAGWEIAIPKYSEKWNNDKNAIYTPNGL